MIKRRFAPGRRLGTLKVMKIVGHRGARGLAPENTIAALLKAIEHGVDEVEFDLRVTKDGVVVLHHNPELADHAGHQFSIAEYSYKQLKQHKPDLATLEEVIVKIARQIPMLIEVKPGVPTQPIVKIIKRHLADGGVQEHLLLGSFSQSVLLELHRALPEVQKVVIERWSGVRAIHRAKQVSTKRLNMNQRWLWRGFISSMHHRGWELYPYTMNDVAKSRRWAKYGIAGVITDYPDRFEN